MCSHYEGKLATLWAPIPTTGAQVVFTVDRACQLLGVGLCGTEGAITVELAVLEVRVRVHTHASAHARKRTCAWVV